MSFSEWERKFKRNEEKIRSVYEFYDRESLKGKKHIFIRDLKDEDREDDHIYSKPLHFLEFTKKINGHLSIHLHFHLTQSSIFLYF